MRIIAGKFRGRVLNNQYSNSLRPTTDKNRESLFNILSSASFVKNIGFKIENSSVLDVCCGTGAVAFEALSRGAKSAVLIDNDSSNIKIVKKNSEILSLQNEIEILRLDVNRLSKNERFFDLIFIDPPYSDNYFQIIENLLENNWIQKNSLVVVEFKAEGKKKIAVDFDIKKNNNLLFLDHRNYGKTSFLFLRLH